MHRLKPLKEHLKIGQVIPLRFKNKNEQSELTMTVSSTDPYFHQHPNALAYAWVGTTSQDVDLVFNESYIWVLNREQGTNRYDIEIVAIHEILHILGLRHSQLNDSVMWPSYQGLSDMSPEDVQLLQAIHGVRSNWSSRLLWLKGYFQRLI